MKLPEGRNRTILAASMASFPYLFENFLKYWIGKCYTEHKWGIAAFCAQAELGLRPAEYLSFDKRMFPRDIAPL